MTDAVSRQQLRRDMRARRRNLSEAEQLSASEKLVAQIKYFRPFKRAHRIALYVPNDGEMDAMRIAPIAVSQNKLCYLPVVRRHSARPLMFAPMTPDCRFTVNSFGIPEPLCPRKALMYGINLDIVLMPLVAFDTKLNRLGMGGGFYDRAFASHNRNHYFRRPLLIGVAHDFQKSQQLEAQPWDVKIDAVITERCVYT